MIRELAGIAVTLLRLVVFGTRCRRCGARMIADVEISPRCDRWQGHLGGHRRVVDGRVRLRW